jgi:hypothetical protein
MSEKTFLGTYHFEIKGDISGTDEQIAKRIKNELDHALGEVEFDGESLPHLGEQGLETMFGTNKSDLRLEEFAIRYDDHPDCEHCGENHDTFAASILLEGVWWCLTCATQSYGDITEDEAKEIEAKEKEGKKKWLKMELKKLG